MFQSKRRRRLREGVDAGRRRGETRSGGGGGGGGGAGKML